MQICDQWLLEYEFTAPLLRDLSGIDITDGIHIDADDVIMYHGDPFSFHKYNGKCAFLVMRGLFDYSYRSYESFENVLTLYDQTLFNSGPNVNESFIYSHVDGTRRYVRHGNSIDLIGYSRDWHSQMFQLMSVLFRHGLFYFLCDNLCSNDKSFINKLFRRCRGYSQNYSFANRPISDVKICRAIARQLMALGYGRRELHPDCENLLDENLDETHKQISRWISHELRLLVRLFDSGPLTLLQLSRIAVRRALCASFFAGRVQLLSSYLPPLLLQYVANPSEYMSFDRRSIDDI